MKRKRSPILESLKVLNVLASITNEIMPKALDTTEHVAKAKKKSFNKENDNE